MTEQPTSYLFSGTLDTPKIEQFVRVTCDGRPPSHGLEHMLRVRDIALKIRSQLPANQQPSAFDVSLVALLHDVADHKYDVNHALTDRVQLFLIKHNFNSFPIMKCIMAISFSTEKRIGKRWFEQILDPYWVRVRDIVSDADKIEALGVVGGERCLQYAEEIGHHGKQGVKHLLQHMLDKLLTLRDEYIVTVPGKAMAQPLQDELIQFALKKALDL